MTLEPYDFTFCVVFLVGSDSSYQGRLRDLAIKRQAVIQEVVGSTITEKIMTCFGKTLKHVTKDEHEGEHFRR